MSDKPTCNTCALLEFMVPLQIPDCPNYTQLDPNACCALWTPRADDKDAE